MSYTPYTPTPPPAGQATQQPVTTTTTAYSYAYSPYAHPTTPGAYPYPYQAGATAYGWTYPYSYVPQHTPATSATAAATTATNTTATAMTSTLARPSVMAPPVTPHTPTPVSLPQRTATFSAYTPTYNRDTLGSNTATSTTTGGRAGGRRQSNLKGLFAKELKSLMYGFGDDRNPSNDSVSVMEEILIEYIADICQTAAGPTRKSRISIDDLRRALSRPADSKKLARMEELLFMQEDIKRARAQFDEAEITTSKGL